MLKELIGGIAYANLLEYAWHRWLLHGPAPYGAGHALSSHGAGLRQRHLAHHAATDPGHIVTAPVVAFVAVNVGAATGLFGWRRAVRLAIVWTAYLAALEGAHELIHRELMPKVFARNHEFHHDQPKRRFNVFLPLGDFLFGTM